MIEDRRKGVIRYDRLFNYLCSDSSWSYSPQRQFDANNNTWVVSTLHKEWYWRHNKSENKLIKDFFMSCRITRLDAF